MSVLWPIVCKHTRTHFSMLYLPSSSSNIIYECMTVFVSRLLNNIYQTKMRNRAARRESINIFSHIPPTLFTKNTKAHQTSKREKVTLSCIQRVLKDFYKQLCNCESQQGGNGKSKQFMMMTLLWKMALPSSLWCVMVLLTSMPSFSEAKRTPCDDV